MIDGSLDAVADEEQMDLLDLAARIVSQPCASAPQTIRSDTDHTVLTVGVSYH